VTKEQLCLAEEDLLQSREVLQEVKHNSEQRESRLQDELVVTKEQLCLAEEDLDQLREELREVKTHIVSLRSEWEMCKTMLREAQDARRSNLTELAEVTELLRVSQAEWEESQFRCSQVTFLCAALQERETELEAKVKKLKGPAITPIHTGSESRPCCPTGTGTGTGMCARPIYTPSCKLMYFQAPSNVEAITDELKLQDSDSIYMTIPPLLPWILDFSLPTSSSPFTSSSSSLYLSPQKRSVISPTRADIHSHSFCPADTGTRMLLPWIHTLMVLMWSDVHSITCNTDPYLRNLSLVLQSCESSTTHRYEVGQGNGQDAQQSMELERSAVDTGSANPEFTSECVRMVLGDRSLIFLDLGHLVPLSSPSLGGVSRLLSPLYRTFPSERNSPGSMDWPPIGSVLYPRRGNVRRDREEDIGFQVSNISRTFIDRSDHLRYEDRGGGHGRPDSL
jgi:hypothetical protein